LRKRPMQLYRGRLWILYLVHHVVVCYNNYILLKCNKCYNTYIIVHHNFELNDTTVLARQNKILNLFRVLNAL